MAKTFGGEYELKNVEIRTSTIETRKLFLELIWEMKPDAVIDLIRLFNFESLPDGWGTNFDTQDFAIKVFLYHTQYPHCYSMDLTQFGFKQDVRDTPFLAYFHFLHKNQPELSDLAIKGEKHWKQFIKNPKKHLIENWALEQFLPNWIALKSRKDSEWLCRTLTEWSEKWNLTADWCLDFALECLRICKTDLVDEFQIPENYLDANTFGLLRRYCDFWQSGSAWKSALWKQIWKNQNNYSILNEIPDYPEFNYIWKQKNGDDLTNVFEIKKAYFPLHTVEEAFRKQTEEEFLEKFFDYFNNRQHLLVENLPALADEFKEFNRKLDYYISKVNAVMKPFASKTVIKKDGDKHFRWTIENLIPPVKTQQKLAEENRVSRDAIKLAITSVKKLIGLKPKKNRDGRPKGVKENEERRRVSKDNIG